MPVVQHAGVGEGREEGGELAVVGYAGGVDAGELGEEVFI